MNALVVVEYGLEAQHGEYHDGGEHRGAAVGDGHDQSVPPAVVLGRVVRGVGDQRAETQAQRVEDLGGGVHPNGGVLQTVQLPENIEGYSKYSDSQK